MSNIQLKSESDIEKLKESGKILSGVLTTLQEIANVGVKLSDLDQKAEEIIKKAGGKPAFLGYRPAGAEEAYPSSICASVNEIVVHGIPKSYELKEGDIVTFDCGVDLDGFITDAALTVPTGKIDEKSQKLLNVTQESLKEALKVCRVGNHIGDIGETIEDTVEESGFKIIKNLTGHGVGFELHEEPTVFNYKTGSKGEEIVEGMVLAIEPMLSFGSEFVKQSDDGSYVTDDGSRSAHFEVTVAVRDKGVEILTPLEGIVG